MKKCIGIVSWLPDLAVNRKIREDKVNRLLSQLSEIWPDAPILIIAQNWKGFQPIQISNEIIRKNFDKGLGILKARKTLREEFLKTNFDYIIMLDDDALIKYDSKETIEEFNTLILKNPNGFCCMQGHKPGTKYNPYDPAQLNLATISRYIFEREDFPDVDPQQDVAYEDRVFTSLLHYKYADLEFKAPKTLYCDQFRNGAENTPSTWATRDLRHNWRKLDTQTEAIEKYIMENKELPDDIPTFLTNKITSKDINILDYINNDNNKVSHADSRDVEDSIPNLNEFKVNRTQKHKKINIDEYLNKIDEASNGVDDLGRWLL